jgi:hypothetical protein
MYGLRQSALLWYNDLKASLKDLGFKPIEANPCVFVNLLTKAIIVVYVDDLILITRAALSMTALKAKLLKRYKARATLARLASTWESASYVIAQTTPSP